MCFGVLSCDDDWGRGRDRCRCRCRRRPGRRRRGSRSSGSRRSSWPRRTTAGAPRRRCGRPCRTSRPACRSGTATGTSATSGRRWSSRRSASCSCRAAACCRHRRPRPPPRPTACTDHPRLRVRVRRPGRLARDLRVLLRPGLAGALVAGRALQLREPDDRLQRFGDVPGDLRLLSESLSNADLRRSALRTRPRSGRWSPSARSGGRAAGRWPRTSRTPKPCPAA